MIKKALFILLISVAFTQPGLAFSPLSLDDFTVYAQSEVELDEIADSAGHVGSNGRIDIEKGKSGSVTGDLRARGRIKNEGDITIHGDVISGDEIDDDGKLTVKGDRIEGAALPSLTLPSLSFSAKGSHIDVPKDGRKRLPPGSYGKVEVKKRATLELTSGTYYFDTLDTEDSAIIKADAAGGITINVTQKLDFDQDVEVIIAGGTTRDITFNFSGSKELEIESGAIVRGSLIAPRAEVEFEKSSRLFGAVYAREIEFEKNAAFQSHTGPPASRPLAADAGMDRTVPVGEKVILDGSRSSGATGEALSFEWSWVSLPGGSQAAFSDVTSVNPEFVADIAGTYSAALVVYQGGTTSDPDTVTITAVAHLTDLDDFVIYADDEIDLDEIAGVSGNVGSNGEVEIDNGASGVLSGDLQALGEIECEGTITVQGNVITNKRIDGRQRLTVTGTITEKANLSAIDLPSISFGFTSDAPKVAVDKGHSYQLEPGSYRKVDVDKDAALFLAAGDYAIGEFETEDRATIFIQGPVRVHIRNDLDVDDYVEFLLAEGVPTRDVKFYVYDNRVEFDAHAVMRGILIAPKADVKFKKHSRLHGAVYARKIELQKGVDVRHHDWSPPQPTVNYRSIGTQSGTLYNTGLASVAPGSDQVSFTGADLPQNIGWGDRLILEPASAGQEVVYILSRDGADKLTLQSPTGREHVDTAYRIERAYTTIQAWEDDRQGDLVSDRRKEVGVCYNDGPFPGGGEYALATIDGSKTNAEHYMQLTTSRGQRHNGTAGSGVVLDGEDTAKIGIRARDHYFRLEGLEFKRFRSQNGAAAIEVEEAFHVIIDRVIIHDFQSSAASVVGIKGKDDSSFTVRNCLIYDGDTAGIRTSDDDGYAVVYNCTIFGMDRYGIYEDDGQVDVTNTIAVANLKEDFKVRRGDQQSNISSDDSADGPGSITGVSAGDQFVDISAGSPDFHLRGDSAAVDQGTDLAAWFDNDIDGQARPAGTAWDIGADELHITHAPVIISFVAEPDFILPGDSVNLTWATQFAAGVSINPVIGPQPANGSWEVSPLVTTTYTLTAVGPGGTATATAEVSLPEPRITVEGGQLTPEGFYNMVVGPTGTYVITGTYDLAEGEVWVTATSGDTEIKVSGSGGQFSLELPGPGDWQITVAEKTGLMRSGTTTLKLAVDDRPPSLTVYNPDEQTSADSNLLVRGEATDDGSGLDSVTVSSSRYAEQAFGATVDSLGVFTCEVPLRAGENQLTVLARDLAGNQTEKTILATVVLTGLPIIAVTTPAPGTIVLEPTVSVAGTVRSSLAPDQIRLVLGDRIQFPAGENGDYDFVFDDVTLTPGNNTIQVTAETIYGNVSAQTSVFYREGQPGDGEILPTIEIRSPLPGTYLNTATVIVSGTAHSELGINTVTVNSDPAQVTGTGADVSFEAWLVFADDNDGRLDIVVVATDGQAKSTTVKMTVYYDAQPPVIQLTSANIKPAPAVNVVTETPYALTGTISDRNLAGLTINGQSVTVLPGTGADTYNFESRIMLARDQELPVTIEAWDYAGNLTGYELILRLDAALDIEVIAPRDGAELIASADTLDVDVTLRVPGIAEGDQVRVRIDQLPAVLLDRSGTVANGTIAVTATDGEHKLTAEVLDAAGTQLGQRTSGFSIINTANIELKLEKQEPANNADGVETNEFVAVYFNKPVDPQLLQVQLFETAHGLSYAAPEKGADITELSEVKLVEIHRDHEAVPGGVSHFPGNAMAAFYPQRDFAYGATIYVNVIYDNQELARTSFSTRSLPTFIQGFVADQFKTPIAGIDVEIRELGRKAATDSNGSYGFGFGDTAGETISSGRYRAVVNPDLGNRAFGTAERWINVEGGRFNSVGMTLLPVLNPEEPFRRISSGDEMALLAGGDLVLNLSEAGLIFPDGRDHGDVHVQFMELDQIAYPFLPSATPNWAFAIQPMGIEVSGPVAVAIAMPPLFGSHDYVAQIGQRVILIGYDPDALQLVPLGVGLVDADNHKVTSEGQLALERLDYLGYALVDTENQEILERFANGEISLRQMIGELESK